MTAASRPLIALLVPMDIELEPLVEHLDLRRAGTDTWHGAHDDVAIVALLTTIGMTPAGLAAERALDLGASAVAVVGIAGGIEPDRVAIGDVIRPAVVHHRAAGTHHVPHALDDQPRSGTLSCGDDLITDANRLAELAAAGVVALDMETAAIAVACEARGVPWTAFRAISDFAGGGLVSDEILSMTKPDGSADLDAISAYLAADPERVTVLERLSRDAATATEAAARAVVATLPALARVARRSS